MDLIPVINHALADYGSFPCLQQELQQFPSGSLIHLLAIGKSAFAMAKTCTDILSSKGIANSGYLLTKYGFEGHAIPNIVARQAGHPDPDENSLAYSKEIVSWLETLQETDTLIVLLSGGGSSLFENPREGISIDQLIAQSNALLRSGKNIAEINQVRSSMSALKRGKALNYVACSKIYCYALSDVEGNDPAVIASAPFFSNNDRRVTYKIIGDNFLLRKQLASLLPQPVTVHPQFLSDSADCVADFLSCFAKQHISPGIHIFGGEAPVKVTGTGSGGRCTHLALAFAIKVAGSENICLYAFASDGNDNLDGVSGAVVNGGTLNKLSEGGFDAGRELKNCNSYVALSAINAIIPAWKTPVNVNDIYVLIIS
jgi:hydroxypyruvate reductase